LAVHRFTEADWFFKRAASLDSTDPEPWTDRGYIFLVEGKVDESREAYQTAIGKYRTMLDLAHDYKSLPDVVQGLKYSLSSAYVAIGKVEDKAGNKTKVREAYQASIETYDNAMAHYNLATTYWNEDWPETVHHLQEAIRLNPDMKEAVAYLQIAEKKIKGGR